MGMEYVRKTYGVPAKRGMVVRPKVGPAKGFIGAIRSVDANGSLVVKEKPRNVWWTGVFHPNDLEYLSPPNP